MYFLSKSQRFFTKLKDEHFESYRGERLPASESGSPGTIEAQLHLSPGSARIG